MKNSPVGKAMQELMAAYPDLRPEQAHALVAKAFAAGVRHFAKRRYANRVVKMAISTPEAGKPAIPEVVLA
jgi:hypothetical protein